MALTHTSFNNFEEVASWYERTKPLRGENNKGKDIRPIGDRARKWERIVKIDNNCYALSDGYHMGDEHFGVYRSYGLRHNYTPTLKDMAFYAPIVWRKHRDGTETVTFRNGSGPHQHNMRYAFLYRHTPRGLYFHNRNGKHFIEAHRQEYFLAKGDTVPKPIWEAEQREIADAKKRGGNIPRWRGWMRAKNDNASLTFKRTDNGWEFVSGGRPMPVPPKKRVNLDLKAKLKPHIEEFREWLTAIAPLMPMRDYNYEKQLQADLVDWARETKTNLKNHWGLMYALTPKLSQQIITDDEHPMRLQLAFVAVRNTDFLEHCKTEDDIKVIKARFNRWVNKQLGLIKEVKE